MMNSNFSKYTDTRNLKITYLLGAGASYNSIPILNAQALSIIEVANHITNLIAENNIYKENRAIPILERNEFLMNLAKQMIYFGEQAINFGSLDIYARKLYLLEDYKELNRLKFCLSVYFDLWERFLYKGQKNGDFHFSKVDKRYYSLLSVLLEKNNMLPKLNSNI